MTTTAASGDTAVPIALHTFGDLDVVQVMVPSLGNAWYVAASNTTREAVTIDAPRDPDILAPLAATYGWTLLAALDTHVHNDFLSGGPELLASGTITAFHQPKPPAAEPPFPGARAVLPWTLGSMSIEMIATPGHTPEHVSYCFVTKDVQPVCIFSGGALMNGAIARPDLLGPHETIRLSLAARSSLQALLELPGDVPVFPTHHGGSFCASAASPHPMTTIGEQQQANPLAHAHSWDAFLALHTHQGEYPSYFSRMGHLNGTGSYSHAPRRPLQELRPSALARPSAIPIDLRPPKQFMECHASGALNIGYGTSFSAWAGWLLEQDSELILVAERAADAHAAHQDLFRIGYDSVTGWIPSDLLSTEDTPQTSLPVWTMAECAAAMQDGSVQLVLDVRMESEWQGGHLPGAFHLLPHELPALREWIPDTTRIAVHCQSGYRSAIAASLLKRLGYGEVHYIAESPEDWSALGLALVRG